MVLKTEAAQNVPGNGALPGPANGTESEAAANTEINAALTEHLQSMMARQSSEDECCLLGVGPRDAGLCVTKAAGPGGMIRPAPFLNTIWNLTPVSPVRCGQYENASLDEQFAEEMQPDENAKAARRKPMLEADEKYAQSLSDQTDASSPRGSPEKEQVPSTPAELRPLVH